jgi:hypothetical protein
LRAKIRKLELPDGSRMAGRIYAKAIMEFENRIKKDFLNNGQKWAIDIGIEAEWPEFGIEEGYMVWTNEEILFVFDPVIKGIQDLILSQITMLQSLGKQVNVRCNSSTYVFCATGISQS